jgi:hypothetical protein
MYAPNITIQALPAHPQIQDRLSSPQNFAAAFLLHFLYSCLMVVSSFPLFQVIHLFLCFLVYKVTFWAVGTAGASGAAQILVLIRRTHPAPPLVGFPVDPVAIFVMPINKAPSCNVSLSLTAVENSPPQVFFSFLFCCSLQGPTPMNIIT